MSTNTCPQNQRQSYTLSLGHQFAKMDLRKQTRPASREQMTPEIPTLDTKHHHNIKERGPSFKRNAIKMLNSLISSFRKTQVKSPKTSHINDETFTDPHNTQRRKKKNHGHNATARRTSIWVIHNTNPDQGGPTNLTNSSSCSLHFLSSPSTHIH